MTVVLPQSIPPIAGKEYIIKATIDNVVVATTGGQTIDGDTTKTLLKYDSISVYSNGTNWSIF